MMTKELHDTLVRKISKRHSKCLVRDLSVDGDTVTFKLIHVDDTWRTVTENLNTIMLW